MVVRRIDRDRFDIAVAFFMAAAQIPRPRRVAFALVRVEVHRRRVAGRSRESRAVVELPDRVEAGRAVEIPATDVGDFVIGNRAPGEAAGGELVREVGALPNLTDERVVCRIGVDRLVFVGVGRRVVVGDDDAAAARRDRQVRGDTFRALHRRRLCRVDLPAVGAARVEGDDLRVVDSGFHFLDRGDVHVTRRRSRRRLVHGGDRRRTEAVPGGFVAVGGGRGAIAPAGAVDDVRTQRREVHGFARWAELPHRPFGEQDDVPLGIDPHEARPVDGQRNVLEELVGGFGARAGRHRGGQADQEEEHDCRSDLHRRPRFTLCLCRRCFFTHLPLRRTKPRLHFLVGACSAPPAS